MDKPAPTKTPLVAVPFKVRAVFSAKYKIYAILAGWLIVCASMFYYFFKIIDSGNLVTSNKISIRQSELAKLEAEQKSFKLGQQDLKDLKQKLYQPQDFFGVDVNLANELEELEALAAKNNLKLELSGISGTTSTAAKAKTQGDIVVIHAGFALNGGLDSLSEFIESLEHLDFIVTVNSLVINAAEGGGVSANLSADIYLRK